MADRFPLIVNAVSKKIEEIVAGDNLELTGNGIVVGGDTGAGKYLSSDGSTVFWGSPGDVYLTASQTITNKTFENCVIVGSDNTLSNIPNSALINSGFTINGTTVSLGGSITTPDTNTTYSIGAADSGSSSEKLIQLTDSFGLTSFAAIGVGVPSSVPAGSNPVSLSISRLNNLITITGTVVDSDTVTTLQSATGGTPQSGAMTISGTGGATISQDAGTKTINIDTRNDDTITTIKTTGQVPQAGNFTFLAGTEVTLAQSVDVNNDPTITINSSDTITRVKGGTTGTLNSGDITITGGNLSLIHI